MAKTLFSKSSATVTGRPPLGYKFDIFQSNVSAPGGGLGVGDGDGEGDGEGDGDGEGEGVGDGDGEGEGVGAGPAQAIATSAKTRQIPTIRANTLYFFILTPS